jgi:hypothetical protein
VVVGDLGPDHPRDQIFHVGAAFFRVHPLDAMRLGDMEKHRARAVHRMRAHHRVNDRLAEFLEILGPRVVMIDIEAVDRLERVQPAPLVFRQCGIGGAHIGDAGAAAGGRNLDPIQDRRGRRALAVGVVGVPALGRTLAIAVPDQADIRVTWHVML